MSLNFVYVYSCEDAENRDTIANWAKNEQRIKESYVLMNDGDVSLARYHVKTWSTLCGGYISMSSQSYTLLF